MTWLTFLAKNASRLASACYSFGIDLNLAQADPQGATGSGHGLVGGIEIPNDLLEKMKRAAEIYSVSELDRYFDELEGLGEREKQLADHLRELRRGHDIEGILKLLERAQGER